MVGFARISSGIQNAFTGLGHDRNNNNSVAGCLENQSAASKLILSSIGGSVDWGQMHYLVQQAEHHLSLLWVHRIDNGFDQLIPGLGAGANGVGKGHIHHESMTTLHIITGAI